jgi:hypothetical protein
VLCAGAVAGSGWPGWLVGVVPAQGAEALLQPARKSVFTTWPSLYCSVCSLHVVIDFRGLYCWSTRQRCGPDSRPSLAHGASRKGVTSDKLEVDNFRDHDRGTTRVFSKSKKAGLQRRKQQTTSKEAAK